MNEIQSLSEEGIIQDWSGLAPGERVAVAETIGEPYRAVVDALTPDNRVVWVVAEATHLRKAFDCREGVTLTPVRVDPSPGALPGVPRRHPSYRDRR